MPTQPEIWVLKTATDLFEAAASALWLSPGGSTPKTLYSLLTTKPGIPWDKVCGKLVWMVDEPAARTLSRLAEHP